MSEPHAVAPSVCPISPQDGLNAEQRIWKHFREQGINVKAWAMDNGFDPGVVYSVLRGERKCLRGQSHRIAVALGLKASHF